MKESALSMQSPGPDSTAGPVKDLDHPKGSNGPCKELQQTFSLTITSAPRGMQASDNGKVGTNEEGRKGMEASSERMKVQRAGEDKCQDLGCSVSKD